jgi:hypothetical protein
MTWGSELRASKRRAWLHERGRRERRRRARFAPRLEGLERIWLLAPTIVVNSAYEWNDDSTDLDDIPGMVTLDDALQTANESSVPYTIQFNIVAGATFTNSDGTLTYSNPMSGPFVLTPGGEAAAEFPVTIDATTQTGWAVGKPQVYIDGTDGAFLLIGGGNSTVTGLGFINTSGPYGAIDMEGFDGGDVGGNVVTDCVFGIGPTGVAEGNHNDISVGSSQNTIGGTSAAARNIISSNAFNSNAGIELASGASNNLVEGNYIGTDATGMTSFGNFTGIDIYGSNNTIGGTTAAAQNVISGNNIGIIMYPGATGNAIEGNLIGPNASDGKLGNLYGGFDIDNGANNNTIGGTSTGAGNVIAFNGDDGVSIAPGTPYSTGDAILGNSIYGNAKLGIDLGATGVQLPNGSGPGGPNNDQNYPTNLAVDASGTITGILTSPPDTYRVEYFANTRPTTPGGTLGQMFLGAQTVTIGSSGYADLNYSVVAMPQGATLSATATDSNGDTSELSPAASPSLTLHWTGGGDGSNWSDPQNWMEDTAPVSMDTLVFPATGAPLSSDNDEPGLTLAQIDIEGGGYKIGGLAVTLAGGITSATGTNTYAIPTTLSGSNTLNVQAGILEVAAAIGGTGGLTVTGASAGILLLDGDDPYTGDTILQSAQVDISTDGPLGTGTLHLAGGNLANILPTPITLGNALSFEANATFIVGGGLSFSVPAGGTPAAIDVPAPSTLTVTGAQGENDSLSFGGTLTSAPSHLHFDGGQLNIIADAGLPVYLNGNVNGVVYASGNTDLILDGTLGNNGYVSAGGTAGDQAKVELGDSAGGMALQGSGYVVALPGGFVKSSMPNPQFQGEVFLHGGTIKVDADNALGTGILSIGGDPTGLSAPGGNAGLLQNFGTDSITLGNSLYFWADATFSVGGGLSFSGPAGGTQASFVAWDTSTLTVTGAQGGNASLSFDGMLRYNVNPDNTSRPLLYFNADAGLPVYLKGNVNGIVFAVGNTDLILAGVLGVLGEVMSFGDESVVELGDSKHGLALQGSGEVLSSFGVVKSSMSNPNFEGMVVLDGGTVAVNVDAVDALGTGPLQTGGFGMALVPSINAGLLQNLGSQPITLDNSLQLNNNATFNVGPGLTFTSGAEIEANTVLSVTGAGGPYASLVFSGTLTSDAPNGAYSQLTVSSSAGLPVIMDGSVNGTVHAGGSTDLRLGGTLQSSGFVSVGGDGGNLARVELGALLVGPGTTTIPLSGTGRISDQAGGFVSATIANPNFSGTVILNGGVIDISANDGLGGGTITGTGNSIITGDPIVDNPLQVQSGTLNLEGQLTFTQGVTVDSGANLDVAESGTNVMLEGPLAGSGSVNVLAGTLVVSSSDNPYSGTMTQSGGNLQTLGTDSIGAGELVTLTPELTPPRVVAIAPVNSKQGLTSFTVSYNEALDARSAGRSGLYHVFRAVTKVVKKHRITVFTRAVAIKNVKLTRSGNMVTITLAKPFKGTVEVHVQGTVNAAMGASSGVNFTQIES